MNNFLPVFHLLSMASSVFEKLITSSASVNMMKNTQFLYKLHKPRLSHRLLRSFLDFTDGTAECGIEPLLSSFVVTALTTACAGEGSPFVSAFDNLSITISLCLLSKAKDRVRQG